MVMIMLSVSLLFIGCVAISKGIISLTKKSLLGVKSWFVRKED